MPSLTTEIKQNYNNYSPEPKKRLALWIAIGVVTLLILALGGLFLRAQHQLKKAQQTIEQEKKTDPVSKSRQQNQDLIDKVGKLIVLPTGEEPTIATVSDLSKLQGQPFFAKAQLGDKVLIYNKAKKAILYRPSTNQIIELAPLVNNEPTPEAPAATTPAQ